MSRPTLYLHVGSPKAGTSSMQASLLANREALAAAGLYFPTGRPYHTPHRWDQPAEGGHRYLAFAMMGSRPAWDPKNAVAPLAECVAALRADLSRWGETAPGRADALLSSEYWFFDIPPEALRAAVDGLGFALVVVAYVRRQDGFLASLYDQQVRGTVTTEPFADFVARCVADPEGPPWYHRRLVRFAEVFGAEALIVRPFEPTQLHRGDAVADLMRVVGVEPGPDWVAVPRENPSLPTELREVVRRLVAQLPEEMDRPARLALSHDLRLGARPPGSDPRRYALMSLAERRALVQRFDEENARIARAFLGRADGRLFEAPVTEPDPPWPGLDPEALARAGLFAWARRGAR